ncbi:response regulator [Mucilaginibacter arboris]|uniref:histidine kinase n=1 Tax=Mucilaginibacter arboris TaxID=2682090 RepID=A0A7K1SYK6_9SPHI|nr:response regulator [Mucilaginibacter arboris]MVN22391.1 response regulator [Mucilaginibacter arboris]
MKTKISRDLQLGFGLSLLLVLISSIASYISIRNLLDNAEKVDQSNLVILKLENIISTMKDAETGQRGFLLSGDEIFLQPYNGSDQKVFSAIKEVSRLTANDRDMQQHINHLKNVIANRLNSLQSLINDKRAGKSISLGQLKKGKEEMDFLRSEVSKLENQERRILSESSSLQRSLTALTPLIIVFAALLSLLVSLIYYFKLRGKYHENIKLRQDLEHKDEAMAKRLSLVHQVANKISNGDYQIRVSDDEQDSLGGVSLSLNKMAESLAYAFSNLEANEKLQSGISNLNDKMLGQKDLKTLTSQILNFLVQYTQSNVGAFYTLENDVLQLQSGYALAAGHLQEIKVGEGITGQCATSKKIIQLKNIDKNSIAISYASGEIKPAHIVAVPVSYEGAIFGVIELASLENYPDLSIQFLERVVENIGIALHTAKNHQELQLLLQQTQQQAEELSKRQRELENMNSELEAYTQKLQQSDEELRVQQEELEQSNQVLEERSHLLEERNQMIIERNQEIQRKAEELEITTQYKSEFLANMSHELRTPLNSILLLSRYLHENDEGNLSGEQVESAEVILNSGKGLLNLIDEILDLSKIEAGKMDAEYEKIPISEVVSEMQALFAPVAKEKKLTLNMSVSPALPDRIETDKPKLEQILKNLLSNALKFTTKGEVSLKIEAEGNGFIRFAVADSGIGISAKDQELIFEPFRQADGSTRRNYGGTGLGLSISRKLAELLQGEIRVISEPGKGSEFILSVPKGKPAGLESEAVTYPAPAATQKLPVKEAPAGSNGRVKHLSTLIPTEIKDDRDKLKENDKVILIIEDDTVFANALLKFTHEKGYKGLVAVRGDQGIEMVQQYKPDAVLLDIQLPVKDGWEVMEELKSNPSTRHIPVHIMSSLEVKKESLLKGAIDFINKPLAIEQMKGLFEKLEDAMRRSPKKVLIVEDNEQHAKALSYFLESFSITSEISGNINRSIDTLQKREVDCVIMDMGVSGKAIYDSLEVITLQPGLDRIPIIVFTGKHLSLAEESRIMRFADSIVVKTAQSYQRVLDEVALFLHIMEKKETAVAANGEIFKKSGALTEVLKNKTVLIADDDVRNIFSLTKSLEKYKMNIVTATNGREAFEQLEQHRVDIVLMDMMMPEMDGYESISKIRQHPDFKNLPVIAVTAKVMPQDRDACIKAGASDYISKPVDIDQLISLLRVWLYDQAIK